MKDKIGRTYSKFIFFGLVAASFVVLFYNLSKYTLRSEDAYSVFLYYIVPTGVAALSFAALRLPTSPRILAANLVLAVVFGAYGAELYLHFLDKATVAGPKVGDKRKGIEVIVELRRSGIEIWPILPFRPFVIRKEGDSRVPVFADKGHPLAPLAGISNVRTLLCNDNGNWISYESDEYGFNNPRGIWRQVADIAAVGDSFVQGVCVPLNQHMIGLIRAKFPQTINIGRMGTGPLFQLAVIKEYLPLVKPRSVLWFFEESNDIGGDFADELESPFLRQYLESGFTQNLSLRQGIVSKLLKDYVEVNLPNWLQKLAESKQHSASMTHTTKRLSAAILPVIKLQRLRGSLGIGRDPYQRRLDDLYKEYRNVLEEGRNTVRQWHGKLILVHLSSLQRAMNWRHRLNLDMQRKIVKRIAGELGIPIIDTTPKFEQHPNALTLFQGGHYRPDGYAMVANQILDELAQYDVIRQNP